MHRMTCTKRCSTSFPRRGSQAHRRGRDNQRLEPHRDQLPRGSSVSPGTRGLKIGQDPGPGFLPDGEPILLSLGRGRFHEGSAQSNPLQLLLAERGGIVLELLGQGYQYAVGVP